MVLKTPNRLLTPPRRPKLKRSIFRRIIFSGFRQSEDDVFDLGVTESMSSETADKELIYGGNFVLTWFINTSVPAFKPNATESSREFSNRFFSLTTEFKKSVLSIWGAYRYRWHEVEGLKQERTPVTHQFFIKVNLHDGLNGIAYMYQLEELNKRSDVGCIRVFRRLIILHPLGSSNKE
jgi:hypothetical protein